MIHPEWNQRSLSRVSDTLVTTYSVNIPGQTKHLLGSLCLHLAWKSGSWGWIHAGWSLSKSIQAGILNRLRLFCIGFFIASYCFDPNCTDLKIRPRSPFSAETLWGIHVLALYLFPYPSMSYQGLPGPVSVRVPRGRSGPGRSGLCRSGLCRSNLQDNWSTNKETAVIPFKVTDLN